MQGLGPLEGARASSSPPSNRRRDDRNCKSSAGLDTVSYLLRPGTDGDIERLSRWMERREITDARTGEALKLVGSGHGCMVSSPVDGVRFGAFSSYGHISAWVEGRLSALLAGDTHAHGLASPAELENGAARARAGFAALGLHLAEPIEAVRRVDLAGDLVFDNAPDGLAFLRALASLDVPRLKRDVWMQGPRVETVYYRTPKTGAVRMRAYDKGVESGTAAPGERVRFEMQRRYTKQKQMTPRNLAGADWSALYRERLQPWERSADGFVSVSLGGAQRAVLDALESGATMRDGTPLTQRRAERMLGTLVILSELGPDWYGKDYTARRRQDEFRDLGVVLDMHREDGARVPVGDLLTLLAEAFGGRADEEDTTGAPKGARPATEAERRAQPKAPPKERRRADCRGA